MIKVRDLMQWCKVSKACASPSQNLRRERLTYQFDNSSINVAKARPALCESKSVKERSHSSIVRFSCEIIQRSRVFSEFNTPVGLKSAAFP